MTRLPTALAAAAATFALLGVMAMPVEAETPCVKAPRVISRTSEGKPILLASVTVTATALPAGH